MRISPLFAVAFFAAPFSAATAQSVTTAPVGAMTIPLSQGYTLVGLPLLGSPVIMGVASGNTASSISLSGVVNVGASLAADGLYYIEITGGDLEGERFDVDTAATISAGNSSLFIKAASVNNTMVLSGGEVGSGSVCVRPHITLEKLASLVSPPFEGSNSVSSADQVLIYDPVVQSLQTYFLRADNVTWRKSGVVDSVGKTVVIPPGVGVFVRKASSAASMVQVGEVRTNDFAMPMRSGLNLYAYGYPDFVSPVSIGASMANGWTGSNSVASADQIISYNPSLNAYDTYFLRSDGTTWRQSGFNQDVKATQVVGLAAGFWIKRSTEDTNYILTLPYAF